MARSKKGMGKTGRRIRTLSRKSAKAVRSTVKKSMVTLGDLLSTAYEVTGSTEKTVQLLSDKSPLYPLLGRRIEFA